MNDETIKKVMQELGRRGGKKGGKSTSKAKKRSSAENLVKARANIKRLKEVPMLRDVAVSLEDLLGSTAKSRPKSKKNVASKRGKKKCTT